jgi:ParB family chromosome partitioning protein
VWGVSTLERTAQVEYIPVSAVLPNPYQPRREFGEDELAELVSSVREMGILQPILVRRLGAGYELVAGERRLRAAKLAGLPQIPALVINAIPAESAAMALVENLQRADLSYWEEAEAYRRLMRDFNWTQEQLAKRVGKSQAAIANKVRLLRLEPEIRDLLQREGLSERHARALLGVTSGAERMEVALEMAGRRLTVRETEALVERHQRQAPPSVRRGAIRDIRLVLNTLRRALEPLARHGIPTEVEQAEDDRQWTLTVRIPKR